MSILDFAPKQHIFGLRKAFKELVLYYIRSDGLNIMTNTNNTLPEIPEVIAHKIMLMAYALSPHPTARFIKFSDYWTEYEKLWDGFNINETGRRDISVDDLLAWDDYYDTYDLDEKPARVLFYDDAPICQQPLVFQYCVIKDYFRDKPEWVAATTFEQLDALVSDMVHSIVDDLNDDVDDEGDDAPSFWMPETQPDKVRYLCEGILC